jgi:hypothetical protein
MKRYTPKNTVLSDEQKKELDKITNEIMDKVLSKEHEEGHHKYDKKVYCPLCKQETIN